jgi:hypothetical protein
MALHVTLLENCIGVPGHFEGVVVLEEVRVCTHKMGRHRI